MSFKCDNCGQIAPKNTVCELIPAELREVETPEGTIGTQIVREFKRCVNCAPKVQTPPVLMRFRRTPGDLVTFATPRVDRE